MDAVNQTDIEWFIAEKALAGINGDMGFVLERGDEIFIWLVDGAGHGLAANNVARACCEFIEGNLDKALPNLMQNLHESIQGTRGGVAVIAALNRRTLQLRYVGIGNISLRKFGETCERAITQEGIIGYAIRTPREKLMQIARGDTIVFHTDGIINHFNINDYPAIMKDNAKIIAQNIIGKFGKKDDDATCIVLQCKKA